MSYSAIRLSGAANDGKSIRQSVIQPGHGFSAGDVIRYNAGGDGNSAEYVKALADSAYNAEACGVVEAIKGVGDEFVVVYQGEIDVLNFPDVVSAGSDDVYFLSSENEGDLTPTSPTSGGDIIKPILTRLEGNKAVVTNYVGTAIGGKSTVSLSSVQPVGQVVPWAGASDNNIPDGWVYCDGQTLDTENYSELYNTFKSGSGSKNGYGSIDPNSNFPMGVATKYGFEQDIVFEGTEIFANLAVGKYVYQGPNLNPPGPIWEDGSRVIGKILSLDEGTRTIRVAVEGRHITDDEVAGTTASRRKSNGKMFGNWDPDSADGIPENRIDGCFDDIDDIIWNDLTETSAIESCHVVSINVPDLRGRMIIGNAFMGDGGAAVGGYYIGDYGGEEEHIMTKGEMPKHQHPVGDGHRYWRDDQTGGEGFLTTGNHDFTHTSQIAFEGNDMPMSNMPPWLALRYIIRVSSIAQAALLDDVTAILGMKNLTDSKVDYAGSSFGDILIYEHDAAGGTYGWYNRTPLIRNIATNSGADLVFHTSQAVDGGITPDGEARWSIDQTYGSLLNFNRYTHGGSADTEGLTGTTDPPKIQISTKGNGGGPAIYTSGHGTYTSAEKTSIIFDADDEGDVAFRIQSQGLWSGGWPDEPLVNRAHGRSAEAHMRIESGGVTDGTDSQQAGYVGFNTSTTPQVPFHFNVPWNENAVLRIEATGANEADLQLLTVATPGDRAMGDSIGRGGIRVPGNTGGQVLNHGPQLYAGAPGASYNLISLTSRVGPTFSARRTGARYWNGQVLIGITAGAGAAHGGTGAGGNHTNLDATLNVVSSGEGPHIATFCGGTASSGAGHGWDSDSGRVSIWAHPEDNDLPASVGSYNDMDFGIRVNSVPVIKWDSNLNCNMGRNCDSDSTDFPLRVKGNAVGDTTTGIINVEGFTATGTPQSVRIWAGGGGACAIGTYTNNWFSIKTNNTNRIVIDATGKCSFGLASAEYANNLVAIGSRGTTAVGMMHGQHELVQVSEDGLNVNIETPGFYAAGFENAGVGGGGIVSVATHRAMAAVNDRSVNAEPYIHSPLLVGRTGPTGGQEGDKCYIQIVNRYCKSGAGADAVAGTGCYLGVDGPRVGIWNWGFRSGITNGQVVNTPADGMSASGIDFWVSTEDLEAKRRMSVVDSGVVVGNIGNWIQEYRSGGTIGLEIYSLPGSTLGISCDSDIFINNGENPIVIGRGISDTSIIIGNGLSGETLAGSYNIAIGDNALHSSTTGSNNLAMGYGALESSITMDSNIAIGLSSLTNLTQGTDNIAIGNYSQSQGTSGEDNLSVGNNSLFYSDGSNNVAIGSNAHYGQDGSTGSENVSIGYGAHYAADGASGCVAVGYMALGSTDISTANTGWSKDQTAVGYKALQNHLGVAADAWNVAVGSYALNSNNEKANVAVGTSSLRHGISMSYNTAVGINAGGNVAGDWNVALGHGSMHCQTGATGNWNTGLGSISLYALGAGYGNVAVGYGAAQTLQDGHYNVFVGYDSGKYATAANTLHGNVVIGKNSGLYLGTEDDPISSQYNVIIGDQAGIYAKSMTKCIAIGANALGGLTSSGTVGYTGACDIAIGYNAMSKWKQSHISAGHNVCIGDQSAETCPSGQGNVLLGANNLVNVDANLSAWTVIGNSNGQHILDDGGVAFYGGGPIGLYNLLVGSGIASSATGCTGSYNTMVGSSAVAKDHHQIFWNNTTLLGHQAGASADWTGASNEVVLGNNSIAYLRCKTQTLTGLSDARDKTDIEDVSVGLDFVNALKPRFFTWNERNVEEVSPYIDKKDMGFIAQELDEVETQFGVAEQTDLVDKSNPERLETRNARLIPVLVKAIQELSAKVEELEGKLNNE